MSNARPITAALKELRRFADELRELHMVDGEWPPEKTIERLEYLLVVKRINDAEKEWHQVRQETLRLKQIESTPEENAA